MAWQAVMKLHATPMGEGRTVVLLHGLFGQGGNFSSVQKRLAATHRVIALDLRNHGASPHAPCMGYGEMAADVLETLRALDAAPCTLVGHSMGGKVAMAAALAAPQAVAALVVSDIAPVAYPPGFRAFAEAMQALPLTPGLTRAQADASLAEVVDAPGVRGFLLQNLRLGAAPAWKIGLDEIAAGLPQIEAWDIAGVYSGPTLFVAGGRSDYILPEHRPVIRALFPAARFVTLKNAGHWVHADDPDGFVDVLTGFLRAAAPAP
jgi:pimeloyl-ACP methyl ester carboxylesterase